MLRKNISLALVVFLVSTIVCARPTNAKSKAESQAQHIQRVKAGISKLGVGEKARVDVRLQNKTEVRGFVYQVGDDDFVVRNSKTGADTTVAYRDVTEVKGRGLSKGAKIAIGVGIGVAVAAAIIGYKVATVRLPFGR